MNSPLSPRLATSTTPKRRWFALALGLLASLAAIGQPGSITVANGEVTITNSSNQTLNFPVTATGDSSYDRYLSYSTVDDSAVAGADYTATSGVFKLAAGATTGQIPVTALGKSGSGTLPDKRFTLNVSGATGTGPEPAFTVLQAVSGTQGSQSVVSLDINGDGKPDLVSNNSAFRVVAMLNTSAPGATTPSYAAPQKIADISFAQLSVGDVDGDGRPDLAVVGQEVSTATTGLLVLRNATPAGTTDPAAITFTVAATLPVGTSLGASLGHPLLVDVTGDGRADAVMVNPNDQQVRVFRNTTTAGGAISFGAVETYAPGISGSALAAGDWNNDGRLDLAVGNGTTSSATAAQVLFNQGGSTLFAAAQDLTLSGGNHNADDIATGDFNNDGKDDLVLLDRGGGGFPQIVLNTTAIGSSSFSFTAQAVGTTGMTGMIGVVATDFNGDGLVDFAVTDGNGPNSSKPGLHVFQNVTAPGANVPRFVQTAAPTLSMTIPGALTTTDFNTDGKPDLAVVKNSGAAALDVLTNSTAAPTATLAFGSAAFFDPAGNSTTTIAADFNRDGRPDLLTAGAGVAAVNLNTTPAGAGTPSFGAAQTLAGAAFFAVAADINGDGVADFITTDTSSAQVSVQLNTTPAGSGTITAGTAQSFAVGSTPRSPAVADLNGDGRLDLVVLNLGNNSLSVLLNTTPPGAAASTTPSFTAHQVFATGNTPFRLALADVNGDGKPDLIVTNAGDNSVSVRLNALAAGAATLSASSFSAQQAYAVAGGARGVTAADVNGDGKPDLIVTNLDDNSVSVLLNAIAPGANSLSVSSFAAQQAFAANTNPYAVVATDLDGDGKPDLAVVNSTPQGTFSILRNTTPTGSAALDASSFAAAFTVSLTLSRSYQTLAAADFNGDGRPDLAASANNTPFFSVALNRQYDTDLSANSATGTIHYNLPVAITASPTSRAFGSVAVGVKSAVQSVTLTNSSGNQVALSIPASAGDFAVESSGSNRCGATLNGGGASCNVYLSFTPTTTGSRDTTLSINSGQVLITLTGTGEVRNPQLSFVADSSLAFGSQPVNAQSDVQSLSVRNSGNVPLNLASTAGGSDPTAFALDASRTCGATLAVNTSCTYAWRFTPTAVRAFGAAMTLSASDSGGSNAAAAPLTANLSGTGTGAIASLTPASRDFGSIPVGNSSNKVLYTLNNSGNAALSITSILSNSAEFVISDSNCGAVLAAMSACQFMVRFEPAATGALSGQISVMSNAIGGVEPASLTGTGEATCSVTASPLAFGSYSAASGTLMTSTLSVTCTAGTTYNLGLDSGTGAGASATTRKMTGASSGMLNYGLFRDSGRTQVWGNSVGSNTVSGTGNGAAQSITVYAQVPASQAVDASSYIDSIVVTLTGVAGATTTFQVTASAAGALTLNPAGPVNLGNQQIGTTGTAQIVTVTNSGNAVVKIGTVAVSGHTGDFSVSGCANTDLNPGAHCDLSVAASPQAAGNRSVVVTVNSDANDPTLTVNATGTQPGLTITGDGVFGDVRVMPAVVPTRTLTLTNSGTGPVTVNSVGFSGAAGDFSISQNNCAGGGGVLTAPGNSCTVVLSFNPQTVGLKSATIEVASNASTQTVDLSGNGVQPGLMLSPSSASFGDVRINAQSSRIIILTNTGSAALEVGQIPQSIGNYYLNADTCSNRTIPVDSGSGGNSCGISVTYTPTTAGLETQSLIIPSNAGPQTLTLSGTGTQPGLTLSGFNGAFGNQLVGVAGSEQSVIVTNSGTASLEVTSVMVAGSNAADFAISDNGCSALIAVNDSCAIKLRFTPGSSGPRGATLNIASTAPGSPATLPLSGTGTQPSVSIVLVSPTDGQLPESPGSAFIGFELSEPTSQDVVIELEFAGTATLGADYIKSLLNTVTIRAGQTQAGFLMSQLDDAIDEPDETIIVRIVSVTNANLLTPQSVTLTIVDDDNAPTVSFATASQTVSEADGTALVTAQLSGASAQTVTVNYSLAGTADGTDYSVVSNASPLTFAPGETVKTITLALVADAVDEPDETVTLTLGTITNAAAGAIQLHTLTINDNNDMPHVSFALASSNAVEGTANHLISVTLDAVSALPVSVPFTVSGTAVDGTDYTRSMSPLVIPAGASGVMLTVNVIDDLLNEPAETAIFTFGTPTNALSGSTSVHTLTLADNDAVPSVNLSAAPLSISEAAAVSTLTATLSAVSGQDVTVNLSQTAGNASAADYTLPASIVIPAGQLTGTAAFKAVDDAAFEGNETATISMGTLVNATAGAATGVVITIVDNDAPPPSGGGGGGSSPPPEPAPVQTLTFMDAQSNPVTVSTNVGNFSRAGLTVMPESVPEDFIYPAGFFAIDINRLTPGATVTLSMQLPSEYAVVDYVKCASVCAPFAGAVIEGSRVTLTLTDGGAGDADGLANGVITDPGAPAFALPAAEPEPAPASGGGAWAPQSLLVWLGLLLVRRWRERCVRLAV